MAALLLLYWFLLYGVYCFLLGQECAPVTDYMVRGAIVLGSAVLLVVAFALFDNTDRRRSTGFFKGDARDRARVAPGWLPSFPAFGYVFEAVPDRVLPEDLPGWLDSLARHVGGAAQVHKSKAAICRGIDVPSDLLPWWDGYRHRHPKHAMALIEAWQVMASLPGDPPASPYPGGHGGATLLEHSWSVVRTLLSLQEWPTYRGIVNSEGHVAVPLRDASSNGYTFDRDDPMVPLCAFTHDIGKSIGWLQHWMASQKGRALPLSYDDHDTKGKMLLRVLPSWRALGWDEYQRALICIGYYHHPQEAPNATWVDDRAMALTALIHHVDVLTGEKEGAGEYARFIARPVQQPMSSAPAPTAIAPAAADDRQDPYLPEETEDETEIGLERQGKAAPEEEGGGGGAASWDRTPPVLSALPEETPLDQSDAPEDGLAHPEKAQPRRDKPAGKTDVPDYAAAHAQMLEQWKRSMATAANNAAPPSAQAAPGPAPQPRLPIGDDDLLELVTTLLLQPGALTGKPSTNLVGVKYGSWLYLRDPALNDRMRHYLQSLEQPPFSPQSCIRENPGVASVFSRALMEALARRGALMQEWEGKYYGPASSFFFASSRAHKPDGSHLEPDDCYYIICRAFAFGSSVFYLPDVRWQPTIIRPVREKNPLSDPASIESTRARLASWTEPEPPVVKRSQVRQERARDEEEKLRKEGISRVPFSLEMIALLDKDDYINCVVYDENKQPCYRADILLQRFAEPQDPHETIDIDGVPCWRFVRRSAKKSRQR